MSMKRSKEASRRRTADRGEESYWGKKEEARVFDWDKDVAAHDPEAFVAYGAGYKYAKDDRVVHKVFGAGVVTDVDGPKIDVLFKVGQKKLAHDPNGGKAPAQRPPPPAPEPEPEPTPPEAREAADAAETTPQPESDAPRGVADATPAEVTPVDATPADATPVDATPTTVEPTPAPTDGGGRTDDGSGSDTSS